mmetsp:Transcript_18470/g.32015  ORF Transcript_18470/g.32015 Transcript_18470/m.32015 type:complete len:422 (-) Transcript_18470:1825-3090(-)
MKHAHHGKVAQRGGAQFDAQSRTLVGQHLHNQVQHARLRQHAALFDPTEIEQGRAGAVGALVVLEHEHAVQRVSDLGALFVGELDHQLLVEGHVCHAFAQQEADRTGPDTTFLRWRVHKACDDEARHFQREKFAGESILVSCARPQLAGDVVHGVHAELQQLNVLDLRQLQYGGDDVQLHHQRLSDFRAVQKIEERATQRFLGLDRVNAQQSHYHQIHDGPGAHQFHQQSLFQGRSQHVTQGNGTVVLHAFCFLAAAAHGNRQHGQNLASLLVEHDLGLGVSAHVRQRADAVQHAQCLAVACEPQQHQQHARRDDGAFDGEVVQRGGGELLAQFTFYCRLVLVIGVLQRHSARLVGHDLDRSSLVEWRTCRIACAGKHIRHVFDALSFLERLLVVANCYTARSESMKGLLQSNQQLVHTQV